MRSNVGWLSAGLLLLATALISVTGCSGGADEFQVDPSTPQLTGGSVAPENCGSAILDPVPPLSCDSLAIAAPAASVNALADGYWTGRFVDQTQDVQGYMIALVAGDGRFQLQAYRYNETNLCHNWEAALTGEMTIGGNTLSGNGRIIALIPTLADGTQAADLQIDGVVAERESLTGTWTASSSDAGCFVLDQYWGGDYEATSALGNLVGTWTDYHSAGATQLSVDASGTLSASDQHGCNWTGRFGMVDDRYSLYEFEADLQSCDRAGHYTGLAWHGPGWEGEHWLKIRADDRNQALLVNFSSD
jgi:hypothetical protein